MVEPALVAGELFFRHCAVSVGRVGDTRSGDASALRAAREGAVRMDGVVGAFCRLGRRLLVTLLRPGAELLSDPGGQGSGLHVYAAHLDLQIGPLALLAAVPFETLGPTWGRFLRRGVPAADPARNAACGLLHWSPPDPIHGKLTVATAAAVQHSPASPRARGTTLDALMRSAPHHPVPPA